MTPVQTPVHGPWRSNGPRSNGLECHNETQAGVDFSLLGRQEAAHSRGQERPVQGDHLRHIGDGLPRKPTLPLGESDVARGLGQTEVGRQHDCDDRANPTAIERISLYDEDRTPESWFRADRGTKRGPPNLASSDYHRSLGIDFACIHCSAMSR